MKILKIATTLTKSGYRFRHILSNYELMCGVIRHMPQIDLLSPQGFALGVMALGILFAVSLSVAVLIVGLRLSKPTLALLGSPPSSLPAAEIIKIPSPSGSLLHGWWVPAFQPGGGAVILMHGAWDNRMKMVSRACMLHQNGFAVLLFDLQAHGESSGRRITFGRLEGMDAAAAAHFVWSRLPDERVGAIGVSLGGAAALLGPLPLKVDALVLESVYPDIDTALANRLRVGLGGVAGRLLTPLLVPLFKLLLPPILGVMPAELRPIDRVATANVPLLIASGTLDIRTPLKEAKALFNQAAEPKRFWAVQGAAHVDLEQHAPEQYWHNVLPFLIEHLRPEHGQKRAAWMLQTAAAI